MKTPLITRQGYIILQQELEHLWKHTRPEITEKVTWAASLGDRSENADYKENKRKLKSIDKRIRYLTQRLTQLKIIDHHPQQKGKVFFGATVTIENLETAKQKIILIVGYDEIFHHQENSTIQRISIDSPMARALIGKIIGDIVYVKTPTTTIEWEVLHIEYIT